ncbi:MAG: hypothetical protein DDG60_00510 [Anaerolineae bacterium]|nr:MAG: hypothetical protein DDG60_00510 [Anaerolineae bacterium]
MKNRLSTLALTIARWLVPLAAIAISVAFFSIAPAGLWGKLDAIGYAVCHQLDERSFHVDSHRLPLCARCSGMYLGAVLGILYLSLTQPRRGGMPPKAILVVLAVFGLAFVVDGGNSYLYLLKQTWGERLDFLPNLYLPNNTLRLLTGTGVGLGLAVAVFLSFNQTMWIEWDNRPILGDGKQAGMLFVLALGMVLLVLMEWEIVLYLAAFLSSAGVLLLLSMVYSMLWTMLMRQENSYGTLNAAWLAILAGLTLALLQITLIDVFRLWLTGTWGSFPLP